MSDQGCANYGELPFHVVREQGIERKAGAPHCTPALLLFWLTTTPTLLDEVEGVDDLLSTEFEALFAPHTRILARAAAYGVNPRC